MLKGKLVVRLLLYALLFCGGAAAGLGGYHLYTTRQQQAAQQAAQAAAAAAAAAKAAEPTMQEVVKVRIYGGETQWFDGVRWNDGGSVRELQAADPLEVPSEEWQALAARIAEAKAAERESALTAMDRAANTLSVDQKVVVVVRPATPTPAETGGGGGGGGGGTPTPEAPPPETGSDGNDAEWGDWDL